MAATKTATEEHISLKVLVDEKKNRVLYVHAGKDFVDILLSFLTLPLGTIARLVGKDSNMNKVSVGSLSSLYESVCNMENKHFWTDTCKEMLLQPRSSMESYCHNIKLNIDGTEKTQYFICQNLKCISNPNVGLLSTFKNQKCKCGRLMNRVIHFHSSLAIKNDGYGFVPETAAFIITDDLKVKPDDFQFSCLLMNHRYEDLDAIKLVTVNVTQKDVLDLLKCSLLSTTPLTDVLLLKKQIIDKLQLGFDFGIREHDAKSGIQNMKLKEVYCPLSYLEPPSSNGSKHGGRAFVKKPSLYMVTDDFVVTPSSSFSAVSFVSNSGVPLSDLEEKVINIGQKEGLSILKACLISSSTLTNGLSQFLKIQDEEKIPSIKKPSLQK
ncbi:uncharacterized protein LOC109789750 isoform X2 [Cajanus cajan]|uniref:uncharacterized protein LOC109789750 isoform X2 n=1 Tax=Cajanus cajan TaxID=3821 RepID=UPI00098D7743|nr:uncharacterized protein LOC109789750 isoform X2 [Cajanus cajan]